MAGESPDVFRILISTDNHLGFQTNSEVRGRDSFLAFEEVLETARRLQVDFLLLGGDLFHEHSPSNDTLHTTLKMLNQYCLGTYAVQFATDDRSLAANYLNEHLSVSLPIFIIHGNHDEPSAQSNISALDLVAISHFINYFGKPTFQNDRLTVHPIRLRKGRTTLLLYGIGHIKNERLHRLFRDGMVDFDPADEGAFCVLILHQNRFKGHGVSASAKNCIYDTMVPNFIHLVVWGHEHDCHPEGKEFHIYQPGSSVATSLTEGEAIPKHMGLLEVKLDGYRLTPVPYTAVRPLIYLQESLSDGQFATMQQTESHLVRLIEEELRKVQRPSRPELALPLVRLKVNIEETEVVNPIRIAMQFAGRVANKDIVQIHKKSERRSAPSSWDATLDLPEQPGTHLVIQLLRQNLEVAQERLKVSKSEEFVEALLSVVEDHDSHALERYFQETQEKMLNSRESACDPRPAPSEGVETPVQSYSSAVVGQKRLREVSAQETSLALQRVRRPL